MLKRNSYDDEIPFCCETCGEEFTIEGFVEPNSYEGFRIIPAGDDPVLCPNDEGVRVSTPDHLGQRTVPIHDVAYTGGF